MCDILSNNDRKWINMKKITFQNIAKPSIEFM